MLRCLAASCAFGEKQDEGRGEVRQVDAVGGQRRQERLRLEAWQRHDARPVAEAGEEHYCRAQRGCSWRLGGGVKS